MPTNSQKTIPHNNIEIDNIPAIIWGTQSPAVIVAIHGQFSSKSDPVIETLAAASDVQVVSFDLPNHGDRTNEESVEIWPPDAIRDINIVMDWCYKQWEEVSLFAVSIGAYFGLLTCGQKTLNQAWFLSPLIDMPAMIQKSMATANVSPEQLQKNGIISTPQGENLSWNYYTFAINNSIEHWPHNTHILHATSDNTAPIERSVIFADKFGAKLKALPGGEHWFHTPEQLAEVSNWIQETKEQ